MISKEFPNKFKRYELSFNIGNTLFNVFLDSSFYNSNANEYNFEKFSSLEPKSHNHPFNEIIFCVQGQIKVCINKKNYLLNDNDLLFTQKNTIHQTYYKNCLEMYSISFNIKQIKSYKSSSQNTFSFFSRIFSDGVFHIKTKEQLKNILLEIKKNLSAPTQLTHFIIQAEMQKFFLNICQLSPKLSANKYLPPTQDILSLLSYKLSSNFYGNTLKRLAEELFISERQLSRIIKKNYNMTFLERKTLLRINQAKYYLSSTSLSIDEIADKLYFSDRNSFSQFFKKQTGISPALFRESKN